jgi:hypothetical protein
VRHSAAVVTRRSRAPVLVAAAVLAAATMVTRASLAAFTATTQNSGNQWSAATVVLGDDDTGSALFNLAGMVPGGANASGTKCIKVSYTGSATADIRLYAALSNDTGLGQYLSLTVEEGTGGTFANNCAGFVAGPAAPLYTPGTLAGFASAHGSWASGVSSWQASGADNRTYRITYALQDNNAAQGTAVNATFTWEAESVPHA